MMQRNMISLSTFVVMLFLSAESFRMSRTSRSMTMLADTDMEPKAPSELLAQSFSKGARAATLITGALLAMTQQPKPALAAGKLEEANAKLSNYGFPPMLFVPDGFSPLVSEFGRGNIKSANGVGENPILIQFTHPQFWIVATTTVNNNGEAGTVSANDYVKGDSAFFFTLPKKDGGDAALTDKATVANFILKSLSQKGDMMENYKVSDIKLGAKGSDGQQYYLIDISYTLNTEAGFLVGRKGVVSLTSAGPAIQGLISVTTDKRYKTLEGKLRDIANSFRVYKLNSGVFSKSE